jgi:DNA topoisomerase-3
VECDKRYGYSADMTLKLIQSLYEKKFTTYPRVDTTYLSDDIYSKVPGILQALTPYSKFTERLMGKKLPKSKKVFDNSKVTDHHAIIPTNVTPASYLSIEEKRVYDMVARRFIAAFYPDCEYNQTTVLAKAGEMEFKATGKQIISDGWRELYKTSQDNNPDSGENIMPIFTEGESGSHSPSSVKKTTQPPKYYTEGTLLRAMETAGKLVDDDELREAMKENGIGRPSTRAAIIETLFKRKYIVKEKKNLKATSAGIALIDTIKVDLLKSAKLTGLWENKLRKIESKEYDALQFINELKTLISSIVIEVLSDNSGNKIIIAADSKANSSASEKPKRKPSIRKYEQIACPLCGKGHIVKGKTAYGCSEFRNGCTFRATFDEFPETLTPSQLNKKLIAKSK